MLFLQKKGFYFIYIYFFKCHLFLVFFSQVISNLLQKSLLETKTHSLSLVRYTVYCEHFHPHTSVHRYAWVMARDFASTQESTGISELKLKNHHTCCYMHLHISRTFQVCFRMCFLILNLNALSNSSDFFIPQNKGKKKSTLLMKKGLEEGLS